MLVVKLLGESTQVNSGSGSSVPNIDGLGAQYVMIQHTHTSDRVVEVRTGVGVTTGSIHVADRQPIIIQKERTDLIYSDANDVYATSIVYQG